MKYLKYDDVVKLLKEDGSIISDKIEPMQKPYHGSCCCCTTCGRFHNDCVCTSNQWLNELNELVEEFDI